MINDDYYEPALSISSNSIIKNKTKLEYDYLYKIQSYGDRLFEDSDQLIHEHLFEVIRVPSLDHNCDEKLLVKCVTCDVIYCNHCGKGIVQKGFISI
jgi:hypothetical protein